jgi:membrane protease YdiL (CAAX protease family)
MTTSGQLPTGWPVCFSISEIEANSARREVLNTFLATASLRLPLSFATVVVPAYFRNCRATACAVSRQDLCKCWVLGIVLANHYLGGWIRTTGNHLFPSTVLGHYPLSIGWLHWFDMVFGLGIDTYTEEVAFRRCARHVFKPYLGDGLLLVLITSLLFGAYHWWSGVGNILAAALMGVLFMLFFQRSGSLWPVVLSHYLADVADFA